jgi:hypothetical protein
VRGGVEYPQVVAHLPDQAGGRVLVDRFNLDAQELPGPDGLYLFKTRLVDEVPQDRLPLRVTSTLLVRDYNTDREKALAGRKL